MGRSVVHFYSSCLVSTFLSFASHYRCPQPHPPETIPISVLLSSIPFPMRGPPLSPLQDPENNSGSSSLWIPRAQRRPSFSPDGSALHSSLTILSLYLVSVMFDSNCSRHCWLLMMVTLVSSKPSRSPSSVRP